MEVFVKKRVIGLIIAILFLIITAGSIPYIISWLPLLIMAYNSFNNRAFRVWFQRFSNAICKTE